MNIPEKLAAHLNRMKAGQIDVDKTHRMVSLMRQLLELRNERKAYPLLTLFCDWSEHVSLDRNPAGNAALDMLDQMWSGSKNVDAELQLLLAALSPEKLRQQMISVLTAALIEPELLMNPQTFAQILRHMIEDLKGKPITRQEREFAAKASQLRAAGHRFLANRICFEDDEGGRLQLNLALKQIEPEVGGEVIIALPVFPA